MILKTRFGTLELPRDECIQCIATGFYMYCSRCDYKLGIMEDATPPYNEWRDARQKALDEYVAAHPEEFE